MIYDDLPYHRLHESDMYLPVFTGGTERTQQYTIIV